MSKKREEVSDDIRNQVVGAHRVGASIRTISTSLGVPKSTVADTIKRFRLTRTATPDTRPGRPRILNDRDRRALMRNVIRSRTSTLGMLTVHTISPDGQRISPSTIRRELHGLGYYARYARNVPRITRKQARERMKWCKEKLVWDLEWRNVLWSDESRFLLFHNDGKKRIWRRKREAFNSDCTVKTVKFGGGSAMFWGCIGWFGVGPLVLLEGNVTSDDYIQVLNDNLLPLVEHDRNVVFQQDGAPIHRSKKTMEWMKTNDVQLLTWVAQSPDLNPIEHLWDHVDRQVRKRYPLPATVEELVKYIQTAWEGIPVDIVRNLIVSMPRRLEAVKQAKGYATRY